MELKHIDITHLSVSSLNTGAWLKAWLFGRASIPVGAALFDPADDKIEIIADLFGNEAYFTCSKGFWPI
jgi:ParB family chromosome partitioning protein